MNWFFKSIGIISSKLNNFTQQKLFLKIHRMLLQNYASGVVELELNFMLSIISIAQLILCKCAFKFIDYF